MAINNTPKLKEKHIDDLRAAFEHRATWFYFLLDEARRDGLDWEALGRRAILRCGRFHGANKFTATDKLPQFAGEFAHELVRKVFEMEITHLDDDQFQVEFNYCPLVAAWQKLTDNEEDIAVLCDIAMDGDRGIIEQFPQFEFELGDTIAKGGRVCQICVRRTKG